MTKIEYVAALSRAFEDFLNGPLKDFTEPMDELEQANDELMLAIYHHTNDRRRV